MKPSPLQTQVRRVLYLVRHGQFQREAAPADGLEGGLTVLGRRQARLTAKRLSRLPITAIVHSDLRRAAETAAIIAAAMPHVPVESTQLLREGIPGVPDVIPSIALPYFRQVTPQQIRSEQARADRAYRRFFRLPRGGDQHIVLVAHGNVIRYWVCRLMNGVGGAWSTLDVRQCSVTEVILQRAWQRVTGLSDVGHLPPKLWTYF